MDIQEGCNNLSVFARTGSAWSKGTYSGPIGFNPEDETFPPMTNVNKPNHPSVQRQSIFYSARLQRKLDEKRLSDLRDRIFNTLRRSQVWLKSPQLTSKYQESHLGNRIKDAMQTSRCSHRDFLPCGQLKELITQESALAELSKWEYLPRKGPKIWRRPSKICIEESAAGHMTHSRSRSDGALLRGPKPQTYRKIFAILLFIGLPAKIWLFVICCEGL